MAKTKLGKWSVWLAVASIVLIAIGTILTSVYNLTIRAPLFMVIGIAADLIGISAFFLGLVAILHNKERSFFVYPAVMLGALILILNLGILIF
jgi:hypothetical protein